MQSLNTDNKRIRHNGTDHEMMECEEITHISQASLFLSRTSSKPESTRGVPPFPPQTNKKYLPVAAGASSASRPRSSISLRKYIMSRWLDVYGSKNVGTMQIKPNRTLIDSKKIDRNHGMRPLKYSRLHIGNNTSAGGQVIVKEVKGWCIEIRKPIEILS